MHTPAVSSDQPSVRTPEEVRRDFERRGQTVSDWARSNGYRPKQVHQVLARPTAGRWGAAHEIAVKLGLKDGEIESDEAAPEATQAQPQSNAA